jgi:membrane-associated phospholipid phosphatase
MSLNLALSFIGAPRFRAMLVTLLVAVFALQRRWWSAAMLVAATGGMGAISTGIKALIRRQRPEGLPGLKQAGGYSFPSGHSSGSLVFFGALSYLVWRMRRNRILTSVVVSAAGVLVGLIGRSRVELQAHHRSDVVAGYVVGTIWLAIVLRVFARPVAREYQ